MITFYPGPSKIYKQVKGFLNEAFDSGILSMNHRSSGFMELYKDCLELIRNKLLLPEDYSVYFVSSATECWEIIAQSFIKEQSFHLYNGAFGEKWMDTNGKLGLKTIGYRYNINEVVHTEMLKNALVCDLIALTQNETSNGTQIQNEQLSEIRASFSEKLIAVDATSSMAGVYLDFSMADIWYASVQKCFGLPSGLSLLICSPKAVNKGLEIGTNKYYNSFVNLHENMLKYQTTHTPNILDIVLLKKVLESISPIGNIDQRIKKQADEWYDFLQGFQSVKPLVIENQMRSDTVIAVKSDASYVKNIKEQSLKAGITLGNGYGTWKYDTFRIANFPAIEEQEIMQLKTFLKNTL
ncbi:MAG: alanine--glyoxylate aminotransferase family protein [Sporocytophaga sp.]|uniref:aminotransferase class V-fold PLP-dependent enzyme n=1 Tax=Sporocytophaga sp. TaxID=2231183 RepID=UPI001B0459A6|nr:aminotransferase class V-fold PLP-dependent enzyme [Sporocytophaga sp.]MBO9699172.1 alanine--glyoxylate aminotransferase family protein [Sporocytophaga sp.]